MNVNNIWKMSVGGLEVPYRILHAIDYIGARYHVVNKQDIEYFIEYYHNEYELLSEIIALKVSWYMLMNTRCCDCSLPDSIKKLKQLKIKEYERMHPHYPFDEEFFENY